MSYGVSVDADVFYVLRYSPLGLPSVNVVLDRAPVTPHRPWPGGCPKASTSMSSTRPEPRTSSDGRPAHGAAAYACIAARRPNRTMAGGKAVVVRNRTNTNGQIVRTAACWWRDMEWPPHCWWTRLWVAGHWRLGGTRLEFAGDLSRGSAFLAVWLGSTTLPERTAFFEAPDPLTAASRTLAASASSTLRKRHRGEGGGHWGWMRALRCLVVHMRRTDPGLLAPCAGRDDGADRAVVRASFARTAARGPTPPTRRRAARRPCVTFCTRCRMRFPHMHWTAQSSSSSCSGGTDVASVRRCPYAQRRRCGAVVGGGQATVGITVRVRSWCALGG